VTIEYWRVVLATKCRGGSLKEFYLKAAIGSVSQDIWHRCTMRIIFFCETNGVQTKRIPLFGAVYSDMLSGIGEKSCMRTILDNKRPTVLSYLGSSTHTARF